MTGEAPLQFNGVHEQPNDAESYVSNRSLHQPGHLSPIQEDDVDSLHSDLDHGSNRTVDQIDNAAEVSSVSRRPLRRKDSLGLLGDLRNYRKDRKRFSSAQLVDPNGQPTRETNIPAAPADQRQTDNPLESNDLVARDHSANGSDLFSQLRDSIRDMSDRISRLESIVATMASKIDSFLSTRSSRPEDRIADAPDGYLNEPSPRFQLPTDPRPDNAQNNQPEVVIDAARRDAPLAPGFYERPGSPVLSPASAAPAEGTPPSEVRKGGRREYPIRKDPAELATAI